MTAQIPATRYPGYDVLDKRSTPSWDEITRTVIAERLATPDQPSFLDPAQWHAMKALCGLIVVQPEGRPPIPLAAMLDALLVENGGDGYRDARMPPLREAWRIGLAALDAESHAHSGDLFAELAAPTQIALLKQMQAGELCGTSWQGMPAALFFSERVLHDICGAYYSHPAAWSEIGFGGPANPRGYVRMNFDRRDPWEAVEAKSGHEEQTRKENQRVR